MVAKVISGKDIQGALNYNEQKVRQGVAQCIHANMFKAEHDRLNFYDKLKRFEDLNERNTRTKTNTIHISLNFVPGEKLDQDMLSSIATGYMNTIGFGDQPYLVYEHHDAAHPHIHIVSTLIQENGKRIPIHFLGKNKSEEARQRIEIEFGLVKASDSKQTTDLLLPVDISKITYGKSQTKAGIAKVVTTVARTWRYTSLPEFNAILKQYNIFADRGTEQSKMFAKKGLMYAVIDENGKRVGVPIKASALPGKPTLAFLEKQFILNEMLRRQHKHAVRDAVWKVLASKVRSWDQFTTDLAKNGIAVILRTNTEGKTYGITFVDKHRNVVFNGSDLGKSFSASAIMTKLETNNDRKVTAHAERSDSNSNVTDHLGVGKLLSDLVAADAEFSPIPEVSLRLSKKRKKRKPKL